MKRPAFLVMLLLGLASISASALELITPADAPIVVYKAEGGFSDTKEFLKSSITDQGMSVSSVLHISDMLDRTAKDTGLDKKLYSKAESLEFCSVALSYKMSEAHPANLANCPLTIGLYTLPDDEEFTYITYRRPALWGDGEAAAEALTNLLDGIIRDAME